MDEMTDKYFIPNLRNASRVLKYMAERGSPRKIGEIARNLSIPRTSVLRILCTLYAEGIVSKHDDLYHLGPELIALGLSARSFLGLREIAFPYLREITKRTGETCYIAIPSEAKSFIIESTSSPESQIAIRHPGSLFDLHCSATGKIFLAYLHKLDLEEFIPEEKMYERTPNTFTTHDTIKRNLREIERLGYAIDDEEYETGIRCVAAPLHDQNYNVIASIGLAAPIERFRTDQVPQFAEDLEMVSRKISTILGAR